jgi:serine/threonine protein kinase
MAEWNLYRDLNPENILPDWTGHLVQSLRDFGTFGFDLIILQVPFTRTT